MKESRGQREDLIKIVSRWNRTTNVGCRILADTILDVYEDLVTHPGQQTIDAISKRTGFFPSKVSATIVILERERWVRVLRKNKPYRYEVTHDV